MSGLWIGNKWFSSEELQAQADGMDDWLDWSGGEDCPVKSGTVVEFRCRDGSTSTSLATRLMWSSYDKPHDIVAFRIIGSESPAALARQEGGGHYKAMKIQPFEYIHANGIPFAEGCVIKYVSRWRVKGAGVEDLKKARHFLDLLIEAELK